MSGQVWRAAGDTERLVCRRVSLDGLAQVGVVREFPEPVLANENL